METPTTTQPSRIPVGEERIDHPASHTGSGCRNHATQWVVPRSAPGSDALDVLTAELSIQSRNGGLYLPSRSSGPTHQNVAQNTASAHHCASARRMRDRRRVISHQIGSGMTA